MNPNTTSAFSYEISDETSNEAPFARLTASPGSGHAGLATVLDASLSHDDDGSIVNYLFDPRRPDGPLASRAYATGLLLMTTFSASVGGLATPVGAAPNQGSSVPAISISVSRIASISQRPPRPPQNLRRLALGTCDRNRLGPDHRPRPSPLTVTKPSQRPRKERQGPWNPGHPARQPGHRHTQTLKSRSTTRPSGHPRPATGQRE